MTNREQKKPLLSVVIPTYNRLAFLRRCLESLAKQTFPVESFEVLVVDDSSPDGTRDFLMNQAFPFSLRPFFLSRGGAARARNHGILEAQGEVILFTDDDCYACPELLELHYHIHATEKDAVGRGPILIIREWEEISGKKANVLHWSANFFCTSNASVRRKYLLQVGNFDESFLRWEDAELGYRLRRLGLHYRFLQQAVVFHRKPPWQAERLRQVALADGRSARQLFRQHPSLRTWLSGGLHPLSVVSGKFLKRVVARKMERLTPDEIVQGLWEKLIFHSYFIEGLLE